QHSDQPITATVPGPGPIIVHCSAGIGRTGCFIASSIGCQQLRETGQVDILETVCQLRLDRGGMIQTTEQYQFLYSTLAQYSSQLQQNQVLNPTEWFSLIRHEFFRELKHSSALLSGMFYMWLRITSKPTVCSSSSLHFLTSLLCLWLSAPSSLIFTSIIKVSALGPCTCHQPCLLLLLLVVVLLLLSL
uniref:protein-tyrosine-phosphatase n=1 Tax=Monopterus albus TaxID=43700 RepID=A0A3Q3K466_MONAL